MPVNFGLLQQAQAPGIQTFQVPNTAAQNEQGLLAGLNSMQEAQRTALQAKNVDSEISARNQEMDFAKQKLPGELATQKAQLGLLGAQTNESTTNTQAKQMELKAAQYQVQQRQELQKNIQAASAKGGQEAGLDAAESTYLNRGDTDSYMKLKSSREDAAQKIAEGSQKDLLYTGAALHGVMSDATPPKKDPKTGQIIPGKTALQNYTERYPTIVKKDPSAPKPSSFKDDAQFQDTYVVPTLQAALPYQKQESAKQEAMMKSNTYKAGLVVQDAKAALQTAIHEKGAKSQEATDAAIKLQQAQDDANRVASGNNYITGTIGGAIKSGVRFLGYGDTPEKLIKENDPDAPQEAEEPSIDLSQGQGPQQNSTISVPSAPAGRVLVKDAKGNLGHIPQDQMQDALKSGYTQVK